MGGMKGAAFSTKHGDASTAGATVGSDKEHSESRESRTRGLSGCSRASSVPLLAGLSGSQYQSYQVHRPLLERFDTLLTAPGIPRDMEIEREAIVQVVVSAIALVTFVAATVFVATTYSVDGALTAQGGTALVGAIGLFVIVMLGAGIWLERSQF